MINFRLTWPPFTLMRNISSWWNSMEAFPGWEVRETLGTTATGSGLMEHPGTTKTGRRVSLLEPSMIIKTVFICREGRSLIVINGMIDPAII